MPKNAPPAGVDPARWRARLDELLVRHGVPGAVLGILADGKIVEAAAGVLGTDTRVSVTEDSVFQLGSATKPFTATLIMQLVEEGRLDLDGPVTDVLPWFRVADPVVSRTVTCRHLLTHVSGVDGDVFLDTGRGDDCLDAYVRALADAVQIHPLGHTFSYCNTGFAVLGRIVEELRGSTWDDAVRDHIARPLGLTATVTLPEDAILHRVAIGHFRTQGGLEQTTRWGFPRSAGPAGGISATVHDLLVFARAHLDADRTPGRLRLLSPATVAEMTRSHVDLGTIATPADSWGLGWFRVGWGRERLFGHDGGAVGQRAYLRIHPARRLAIALLTNGDTAAAGLWDDLEREVSEQIAGLTPPPPPAPPRDPPRVDSARFIGTYRRAGLETEVYEDGGRLILRSTIEGEQADVEPEPSEEHTLVPTGGDLFLMRPDTGTAWQPVGFFSLPDGSRHVHYQKRTNPRVED